MTEKKFDSQTVITLVAFILVGVLLFAFMFVRNKSIQEDRANSTFSADKNTPLSENAFYGKEAVSAAGDVYDKFGNKVDLSELTKETTLYDISGNIYNLPTISAEEYAKITKNMSYDEVCKIIGSSGTIVSEIDSPGDEFYTVCYFFYGDKAETSASFIFQGGKVLSTANTGLQDK